MFLPVVSVILLLLMLSILLVSSFGSDTRRLARRAELAELCRVACQSALLEVRTTFERELAEPEASWPTWWTKLVPPYDGAALPPLPDAAAPVTAATYQPLGLVVRDLTVRCLDRRTGHRVKSQGLVTLSVEAAIDAPGLGTITMGRTEHLRFYVQTEVTGQTQDPSNPAVSYPEVKNTLSFFPLCAEDRESSS